MAKIAGFRSGSRHELALYFLRIAAPNSGSFQCGGYPGRCSPHSNHDQSDRQNLASSVAEAPAPVVVPAPEIPAPVEAAAPVEETAVAVEEAAPEVAEEETAKKEVAPAEESTEEATEEEPKSE